MIIYDTEGEARAHPEEGRDLYSAMINGRVVFGWTRKQGGVSYFAYAAFNYMGGIITAVDTKKRSHSVSRLLAENAALRAKLAALDSKTMEPKHGSDPCTTTTNPGGQTHVE